MMTKMLMVAAAGALAAGSLFGDVVVPAGETYTLTQADNVSGSVIDLGAGSTLRLVQPSAGFAMYSMAEGAPTGNLAQWRAAAADISSDFTWDTFVGIRTNVSWAEVYGGTTPGYAVLYSGQWYVPADADYGFYLGIDDCGHLEIDGAPILSSTGFCSTSATNNVALTAGWHDIRIVIANANGYMGAVQGNIPGVAYSAKNALLTAATVATAGTHFSDPGDGTVLRPTFLTDGMSCAVPLYANIVATNGAVTVDATALDGDMLRLQGGGIRTRENHLTIVGAKQVVFGSAGPSSSLINYPLFDVGGATFTEADATGFLFTNQVTIARLPPAASCASAIAPGATVAVRGTNTLARFYDDQGRLNLVDWDLYVLENTVVPEVTIRVGAGRTLRYKLCDEFEEWNWYGRDLGVVTNDIVLLDPSASVHLTQTQTIYLYGSISGTGDIWQDGGTTWASARAEIYAACSQTGTVHLTENGQLVFVDQSTAGCASNTVDLAAGATLGIHPAGYTTRETNYSLQRVTGSGNYGILHVGALQTVEIARLETSVKFLGASTGHVIVDEIADGVEIRALGGQRVTLRASGAQGGLVRVLNGGTDLTAAFELTEGVVLQQAAAEATRTLVLSGTGTVDRLVGAGTVRLAAGADIQIRDVASETQIDASAGRLTVLPPATDWRDKVLLWLDPTETGSLRVLTNKNGVEQAYTNGYKLVDAWFDRRPEQRDWILLNNRMWTLGNYDLQPQVYPFLVTRGGPNGLPYLSFGTYQQLVSGVGPTGNTTTEARRLQTWRGEIRTTPKTDAEKYSSASVAWVMMVFGSSRGGGLSMLGTESGFFERAGATLASPIAKKHFELYVDGVAASPTNTSFNGGWQLLSFAGNDKVNALNWKNAYQTCGGQDYGEVIFFRTKPTEVERIACERYLAAKWGLAGRVYKGDGCPLRLQGRGDVELEADVDAVLDGSFAGTVTLGGGSITVAEGTQPPTEAEIPATGRVAWFDANAAGALALSTRSEEPLSVRVVHGRDNAGVVTTAGNYYLLGTYANGYDRRPWLRAGSRGGMATNWIDFANKYGSDNKGNTLRLFQEPAPTAESSDTAAKSVNVRTAFVALDSSNGGGMPLIDKVGADGQIKARQPTRTIATPIWTNTTVNAVKGGTTRLDGVVVNGTKDGYHGRAEVLSLETTANVPISYFGWYGLDNNQMQNAEILGEILLFNQILSGTERAGIEAYLMNKWAGTLPSGYVDVRHATLAGSGTVRARSLAALPQFAASFAGTVEATQTDFAFTLDTRSTPAVADAIVVPCALRLSASCAVSVTCACRPRSGRYALLTAQTITGVEQWTLNVSGETGSSQPRLVCEAGTLFVEFPASGSQILIR